MSGHTKGPWIVATDEVPHNRLSVEAPDEEIFVCEVDFCNERDANARLIAAAPDMLEALQGIMETIDAQVRAGMRWDPTFVQSCRDAIAKASGTEAGTAKTAGLGPKDDGPVLEADAERMER